jgi:hypothetical protein
MNGTKLTLKALIGKGSRGSKKDKREINTCRTRNFKTISTPASSSPPASSALKEF